MADKWVIRDKVFDVSDKPVELRGDGLIINCQFIGNENSRRLSHYVNILWEVYKDGN